MVSTSGNGIFKAHENVFISDDYKEFSSLINIALNAKPVNYQVPPQLTWSHKTDWIISTMHEVKVVKENLEQ